MLVLTVAAPSFAAVPWAGLIAFNDQLASAGILGQGLSDLEMQVYGVCDRCDATRPHLVQTINATQEILSQ